MSYALGTNCAGTVCWGLLVFRPYLSHSLPFGMTQRKSLLMPESSSQKFVGTSNIQLGVDARF